MACFVVPVAEAVVVSVGERIAKEHTKKTSADGKTAESPLLKKVSYLKTMLWGGSALLAFEHVWHGEVVPYFPFLTNAVNPADRAEMFREMGTNGVGMAVLVTLVWGVSVLVSSKLKKRAEQKAEEK